MKLTAKQQEVLSFVDGFRRVHGMSPTLREVQSHFGFASSFAAQRHLKALERKGALIRGDGKARSMMSSPTLLRIPFLGSIPAGFSELKGPETEDRGLEIDPAALGLPRSARLFALEVRGDSMIGAHILPGDLAILEQVPARAGDIVAALIDGEVTLKRLIQDRGKAFLRAENPNYPDLLPLQELLIQGVLRTLIRTKP